MTTPILVLAWIAAYIALGYVVLLLWINVEILWKKRGKWRDGLVIYDDTDKNVRVLAQSTVWILWPLFLIAALAYIVGSIVGPVLYKHVLSHPFRHVDNYTNSRRSRISKEDRAEQRRLSREVRKQNRGHKKTERKITREAKRGAILREIEKL